jgi:hypothetical protein
MWANKWIRGAGLMERPSVRTTHGKHYRWKYIVWSPRTTPYWANEWSNTGPLGRRHSKAAPAVNESCLIAHTLREPTIFLFKWTFIFLLLKISFLSNWNNFPYDHISRQEIYHGMEKKVVSAERIFRSYYKCETRWLRVVYVTYNIP